MAVDAALEAVRRPAELARPALCPRRGREAGGQPASGPRGRPGRDRQPGQYVEPVQLQVVCYQLWENLGKGEEGEEGKGEEKQITLEDLAVAGDVDKALEHFYTETLAAVLAEFEVQQVGVSERALRTWFDKELITETGIRNTVFRNEAAGRTGSIPNVAVDALARRFLLRTELRGGGAWLELIHDRFVEPIRESNAAWFPLNLGTLQRQAALWDQENRPVGLLLQGNALVEAEKWVGTHERSLEPHEAAFLLACRQARQATDRERRQARRIRWLAIGLAIGVITAVAMTILANQNAVRAEHQSKLATSRELAGASVANLVQDPELSVLLAIEALKTTGTSEAEDALRQALQITYHTALRHS